MFSYHFYNKNWFGFFQISNKVSLNPIIHAQYHKIITDIYDAIMT